ncbi:hypothetical protein JFN88_22750 [Paenibacillus sp. MAHUQ-46]|uniref:Uncharacterized protein n=1 Tax=Paenibacillus roseus TaxID=2798579 RepID=A0A934JC03_9BACL|nr:hypothetical protein [Paenibacillus roseus]
MLNLQVTGKQFDIHFNCLDIRVPLYALKREEGGRKILELHCNEMLAEFFQVFAITADARPTEVSDLAILEKQLYSIVSIRI